MASFPEQGSIYAGLPRGLQCLFLAPESTPDTQTADSTGAGIRSYCPQNLYQS